MRHTLITTLALVAVGVIALPLTASSATQKGKPVIGRGLGTPAQAVAGQRFAVSAKVTKDTGGPLTGGSVSCKATAGAKALTHTQSLRGGVARCSFTLPLAATSVRVALTVKAGTQSASRTFTFAVRPAPKPALSIGGVTVTEGNAGTTTMSFPVTLSKAGTQTVSVSWSTADGTATAPADYAAGNGSLTFAPGETSKSIAVSVVGDLAIEPDETLTVTLANPVNATIATGSATGTIRNEDTQVPVVSGSYKGQLPSGDFLYFEVTQARQVSYFRLNDLRENCSPYGYFEGSVSYPPTALWPISASGSAGAFSTWTGTETYGSFTFTHYEYRTTVQFDGTATVKGTIQLKDEFDYSGSHFSCDTGVLAWTAAKVG
jgi:hypothetical protein